MSLPKSPAVRPNVLAFAPRLSSGNAGAPVVEHASGQVIAFPRRDVVQFYSACPDVWRAFLIHEFGDDEIEVAHFFRVTNRGARKWLDGDGSARLDKLLLALTRPGALDWWMAALPALQRAA